MTDEPRITPASDGASAAFLVRAQPGAKHSGVVGLWNEHLKVALRSPADRGRANDELLEVLAEVLEVKRSALSIASGQSARQKSIRVALPAALVRERLLRALGGD